MGGRIVVPSGEPHRKAGRRTVTGCVADGAGSGNKKARSVLAPAQAGERYRLLAGRLEACRRADVEELTGV